MYDCFCYVITASIPASPLRFQGASSRIFGMACPEHLGLSSIALDSRWVFLLVHVQMGSRFLAELRVWRHRSNPTPRYLKVPHISGTSRDGWSDRFE